jgi:hypothetical protein
MEGIISSPSGGTWKQIDSFDDPHSHQVEAILYQFTAGGAPGETAGSTAGG